VTGVRGAAVVASVAVGIGLAATGCGEDEPGAARAQDEEAVREAITDFQGAVGRGDDDAACAALTAELRSPDCHIDDSWPGSLSKAVIREIRFADDPGASVFPGGAEAEIGHPRRDAGYYEIELAQVGGEWRIDFFPIAVY
jgi:hypothetical protein